jgi:hypothetical protein
MSHDPDAFDPEQFAQVLDGTLIPGAAQGTVETGPDTHDSDRHMVCDRCSAGIPFRATQRVGMYWSDTIINTGISTANVSNTRSGLVPLATHCASCATNRLLFPCAYASEYRIRATLGDSGILHDVEVTDSAPVDDGIPWPPEALVGEMMPSGASASEFFQTLRVDGEPDIYGPEDIIVVLLETANVDPRELYDWDGTVDELYLGKAKGRFRAFISQYAQTGRDRAGFRRSTDS